ncbi:DNA repair protein [Leeuwenhoekiella aestuarii]|uniref:Uncharacterized protein n=1 Tax=Leeuwenhoekiella aestuarii TaxID=2249426 RepID=A0A4Q0NXC2_9FLAO|nr:DNA repair protein [Leeuwenhoekiella aestuarii]RXG16558.1 hypothetical protein DSM04_102131 [Leeuwenhoekiella aestuarii]
MESKLKYKNYIGSIEYSSADGVWYGEILDINDLVSYEAEFKDKLILAFITALKDYDNHMGNN